MAEARWPSSGQSGLAQLAHLLKREKAVLADLFLFKQALVEGTTQLEQTGEVLQTTT